MDLGLGSAMSLGGRGIANGLRFRKCHVTRWKFLHQENS